MGDPGRPRRTAAAEWGDSRPPVRRHLKRQGGREGRGDPGGRGPSGFHRIGSVFLSFFFKEKKKKDYDVQFLVFTYGLFFFFFFELLT